MQRQRSRRSCAFVLASAALTKLVSKQPMELSCNDKNNRALIKTAESVNGFWPQFSRILCVPGTLCSCRQLRFGFGSIDANEF